MEYSYCTLFDKNYLDKGLVMIETFRYYNAHANIYVLAMDEVCYKILSSISALKVVPIRLSDFETEELLKAKKVRSRAEYCWTCTASLISFVLTKFQESYCTYIDADMRFYDDPDKLVDEMVNAGKSVQIIGHRIRNGFAGRVQEELSGKYCVEFNTFKNDEKGKEVLETWRRQTLERCEAFGGAGCLGDQMYLEHWPEDYDCVNVSGNPGAGVAPWNINRYKLHAKKGDEIWVICDKGSEPIRIIFFHYHGLQYITDRKINIDVHRRYWKIDMELAYQLYGNYLKELNAKKEWLNHEYNFYPIIKGKAVVETDKVSLWKKIRRLISGNAYKNIRFRLGNYGKIFLFSKYDMIDIGQ